VNHSASTNDEIDLINQAKDGDRRAFSQLVIRHREGVVNVVYRLCGDPQLAEDVAQEAFIRAWQNLPRYQPRSAFRNWIYRIATNAALDVLRKQRESVDIEDLPLSSSEGGPESTLEKKERAEQVQQAVLALPPASRSVLVLREYENLTYQEIADTLDIPLGTVMSRLNYSRKLLVSALAPIMEAS
jgi:RNA polymerase sigma-70 factor (ECF subfamily)